MSSKGPTELANHFAHRTAAIRFLISATRTSREPADRKPLPALRYCNFFELHVKELFAAYVFFSRERRAQCDEKRYPRKGLFISDFYVRIHDATQSKAIHARARIK